VSSLHRIECHARFGGGQVARELNAHFLPPQFTGMGHYFQACVPSSGTSLNEWGCSLFQEGGPMLSLPAVM
jgi:hypothetical protein